MVEVPNNHHSHYPEPLYGPYYTGEGPVDNYLAALRGAALGFAHSAAGVCCSSPRPRHARRAEQPRPPACGLWGSPAAGAPARLGVVPGEG